MSTFFKRSFSHSSSRKSIFIATAATSVVGVSLVTLLPSNLVEAEQAQQIKQKLVDRWVPPTRFDMISRLKSSTEEGNQFDLLIIGGGATGVGCALDAATRGLKVAMVERDDFSSGILISILRGF